MQNAKDSFYMALRTRLTAINPERTILLRGAVRPGILVEEAEAPFSQLPNDVFVLRWLGLGVDMDLGSTMAAEECEIVYQTCGTQSFGGLDRGRALSEMDEELVAMLQPFYTPKLNYTATPPAAMLTQVFWDEPGFAPVVTAAGPAEPVGKGDGLQLPGAGGVMAANWFSAPAPVARRVRGYFAPVNRAAQTPVLFDPAEQGGFSLDAPPAPWISLGWIQEFTRKPGSKTSPVLTGIPAATLEQVRETLEAQVSLQFLELDKADNGAGHRIAAHEPAGSGESGLLRQQMARRRPQR